MTEAVSLPEEQEEFTAEHGDIPFQFIVLLAQDDVGAEPDGEDSVAYWEQLGSPETMPVVADTQMASPEVTPWTGTNLPGKCVLSPDMEMIHCYSGHGNEEAFEAVLEHAG